MSSWVLFRCFYCCCIIRSMSQSYLLSKEIFEAVRRACLKGKLLFFFIQRLQAPFRCNCFHVIRRVTYFPHFQQLCNFLQRQVLRDMLLQYLQDTTRKWKIKKKNYKEDTNRKVIILMGLFIHCWGFFSKGSRCTPNLLLLILSFCYYHCYRYQIIVVVFGFRHWVNLYRFLYCLLAACI